ncbi:MAG: hypothetical protein IKU80_04485 [Firmicutes bacterium]|nr:hypothetical protein [Bacillota bacterium]
MKKQAVIYAMVLFVVLIMIGAAELLNEKEIIFPEITAIAVGAFMAPKFAWKTNRIRILIFIMICAFAGVGIVLFVPGPVWMRLTLAYGIAEVIYLLSGTSFAPMISAIALPVLLGTESPVYLISAFCLTTIILVLHVVLEKSEIKDRVSFTPVKAEKQDWFDAAIRLGLVLVISLAAINLGWRFAVAPPLLVAFTEFSKRTSGARKMPLKVVAAITLCAFAGALCRYIIVIKFNLPLTLAAAIATVGMILILNGFKAFVPPAGALCILPMLIPEAAVINYPVQIFVGASLFMILSLTVFKDKKAI